MDQKTSIEDLKKLVQQFCEERSWDQYHAPKELAIGAVTEASELLEIFRFLSREEEFLALKDSIKRQHMADELADVLFFLLRFSQMYNFDLSKSLKDKILKNAAKYPVGSR